MKLSEIAKILNEKYFGEDIDISNVGSFNTDCKDRIIYVDDIKFLEKAIACDPAALIVPRSSYNGNISYIEHDDPKFAFIKLLEIFNPFTINQGIDSDAVISKNAVINENATIMAGAVIMEGVVIEADSVIFPNCVIEKNVTIGKRTVIYSGAVIRERCKVGNNCIIHSGTVIGADGYGFHRKGDEIFKIPQIGTVEICNNVEIGANCTIDRATVDETRIGNYTKIDNLVHIAHNVEIGEKCIIAAQAGISGSVKIGNRVVILGQVGIADHLSVADDTIIMPQSGIPKDIKKQDVLFGTPARSVKEHHRINAALKYLPGLLKRVSFLEKAISLERDISPENKIKS